MTILSLLKGAFKTRKPDVVTFERLDYWTMRELFDRIPLHDLIRLNGLASWWSGYVDKVCLIKRSIYVQCGVPLCTCTRCHDLNHQVKVVTIDSTTSNRLGHLLPNITSLDVSIGGSQPFSLSDVTYLINQWSHQLVDLWLDFEDTFVSVEAVNYENEHFHGFLFSLNRITTLRRLHIHSESSQCCLQYPIDLPILAQLECFYFRSGRADFFKLQTSLLRYAGPNLALRKIKLPTFRWPLRRPLRLHQVLAKITMLRIDKATRVQWELFPNLNTVHHMLGHLRSRSHFVELISEMQYSNVRTLQMTLYVNDRFDRNSGQVLANLPPLQSITELELNVVAWEGILDLDLSFKSLKIDLTMFPNLQKVHLKCCNLRWKICPLADYFYKIHRKLSNRVLLLRVFKNFSGVDFTFEQSVYEVPNGTKVTIAHMLSFFNLE